MVFSVSHWLVFLSSLVRYTYLPTPPIPRMRKGELFDYLTEKVALSEKETR